MDPIIAIGLMFFYAILSFVIYFIPSLIAISTNHRNKLPIFILNLFFGWSLIGWVVALIWVLYKPLR